MKKIGESKKIAIIISYLIVILNSISTIVLTQVYLDKLGADTYGLYQMVYSVAQYILILDLGISTTMIRYVTEFDTKGEQENKENFAFHFLMVVVALSLIILLVGVVVNSNLENIYRTLTPSEYILSHKMFAVMVFQILITVYKHYFTGILLANEKYAMSKCLGLFELLLSFIAVWFFLEIGCGVLSIVYTKTAVILVGFLVISFYDFFVIKFKIKFHCWNFALLKSASALMIAMLLQSIVGYVNNSVDKTILGIMSTKVDVAVYSIAAIIITMFNTLPTSISSVFQTKATKIVMQGASHEELENFVIKPGRFQFMVCGGIFAGFTLFGKDFIICWAGESMLGAWKYAIVIMLPNMIPLIQNVCLSILNALDKRIYRSIILVVISILNISMTLVLIKLIGPFGAPLATAISYLIGHVILMNIYYQTRIHLNVRRMFMNIFKGIWKCILIAMLINAPFVLWRVNGSWAVLLCKAIVLSVTYFILIWKIGFHESEKKMVSSSIKKMVRKKKKI